MCSAGPPTSKQRGHNISSTQAKAAHSTYSQLSCRHHVWGARKGRPKLLISPLPCRGFMHVGHMCGGCAAERMRRMLWDAGVLRCGACTASDPAAGGSHRRAPAHRRSAGGAAVREAAAPVWRPPRACKVAEPGGYHHNCAWGLVVWQGQWMYSRWRGCSARCACQSPICTATSAQRATQQTARSSSADKW